MGGDAMRFFTAIPNLADEMLDADQLRVLVHIMRWAIGAMWCTDSVRNMADKCRMAPGTVQRALAWLIRAEWIEAAPHKVGGRACHKHRLNAAIWQTNEAHFAGDNAVSVAYQVRTKCVPAGAHGLTHKEECKEKKSEEGIQIGASATPADAIVVVAATDTGTLAPEAITFRKDAGRAATLQPSEPVKRSVPRRAADPRTSHPAIVAVRELTKRNPNAGTYDAVIAAVGDEPDIERMRACYSAWTLRGFNPVNLAWATEWYPAGGPPAFAPSGARATVPPNRDKQVYYTPEEIQRKESALNIDARLRELEAKRAARQAQVVRS
jgi:hypothetical protein